MTKSHRSQKSLLCLLPILMLWGCDRAERAEQPRPEQAAETNQTAAQGEVSLQLASWEEVQQVIAEQRGKVVVLDVWSTWCVPCVREFPGLVDLHEKYGDQVACISLNCNYTGAAGESPEEARDEIEAFLGKQGATFTNIISTTPDDQLLAILGAAAIPVVRVYDQEGQLQKQFVNDDLEYGDEGFGYEEHIAPLVEQLLQ